MPYNSNTEIHCLVETYSEAVTTIIRHVDVSVISTIMTMDVNNFNGTERSHTTVNLNGSETNLEGVVNNLDVMEIVQLSIAPAGIIGNLTVIVVFLNHKKLRHKIPNRFIVNQVNLPLHFIPFVGCVILRTNVTSLGLEILNFAGHSESTPLKL